MGLARNDRWPRKKEGEDRACVCVLGAMMYRSRKVCAMHALFGFITRREQKREALVWFLSVEFDTNRGDGLASLGKV